MNRRGQKIAGRVAIYVRRYGSNGFFFGLRLPIQFSIESNHGVHPYDDIGLNRVVFKLFENVVHFSVSDGFHVLGKTAIAFHQIFFEVRRVYFEFQCLKVRIELKKLKLVNLI